MEKTIDISSLYEFLALAEQLILDNTLRNEDVWEKEEADRMVRMTALIAELRK